MQNLLVVLFRLASVVSLSLSVMKGRFYLYLIEVRVGGERSGLGVGRWQTEVLFGFLG